MTNTRHLIRLLCTCGGLLLAVVGSSPALALDAACAQWNVSGTWTAIQSNHQRKSKGATLSLQQTGTQFKGSAQYQNENGIFIKGPVVGTAIRNAFSATIYWDDNRVGAYTGEIGPQGLAVGHTFDKNDSRTSADWHADRSFDCLTPGSKPLTLGRVPSTKPTPARTPATAAAPGAQAMPAVQSPRGAVMDPLPSRAAAFPPIGTRPAVDDKGNAAALSATPSARNEAEAQSPTATAKSKANAVSLNPPPLPLAAPLVLPAQSPSALR